MIVHFVEACYNKYMNNTKSVPPRSARYTYEEICLLLEFMPSAKLHRMARTDEIPARIRSLIEQEIADRRDDW